MPRSARDPIDRIIESTFEFGRIMRHRMMSCEQRGAGVVNFLQMHALMIVSEQKGITMKELANSLHVSSPSATSLVNRLVKLRWVGRRRDPDNRKLVRLRILPVGSSMLRSKFRERQKVVRELFRLLSVDEQNTLAAIHEKLISQYQHAHS